LNCLRAALTSMAAALVLHSGAAAQIVPDTARASEFLRASGTDEALKAQTGAMITQQFRANRQLAAYADLFADWSDRYIGYDTLRPKMLLIIANRFSPSELEKLTEFYRTPVGTKYARERSVMAAEYTKIIQEQMSRHYPELLKQIQRRSEELKQERDTAASTPKRGA
jgi:hypothetical protein